MNKNEKLLISVIIPVYNIEEYIGKCIQSIVEQSYSYLQIILVDDGSKDDSGKICDTYAEKDSRIQVIHKENGGLVSARKAGLAVATGDYIGFVDGDDYVEPLFCETLLKFIMESGADFVHTGYIWEKNGKSAEILPPEEGVFDLPYNSLGFIEKSVLDKYDISPSIVSKFFKNDFIKECYAKVPDSQSWGEDLVCLCTCLLNGKKVSLHRTALYHYNIRNSSLIHCVKASNIADVVGCYNALKNIFKEFGVYEELRQSLEEHFLRQTMLVMKSIPEIAPYISLYYFAGVEKLKGKRIVIYGAGEVGQDYYTQISKGVQCDIVGWLDANYNQYHFSYRAVQGLDAIGKMQFDVILIAVKRVGMAMQIKKELLAQGVAEEKIVWEEPGEVI